MPEVDPVTGQPKVSVTAEDADRAKYDRLLAQKSKADQLAESLASERGQRVINKIEEHLLSRVNKLIDEDGECKALKRLLIDMGITINVGEVAVRNLTRLVMKK